VNLKLFQATVVKRDVVDRDLWFLSFEDKIRIVFVDLLLAPYQKQYFLHLGEVFATQRGDYPVVCHRSHVLLPANLLTRTARHWLNIFSLKTLLVDKDNV